MNELQKLLENAGMAHKSKILKEYLVQDGESFVDGAGMLNIFSDTIDNPISEYEEEFANDPQWMAVENKYKMIAWNLRGEMQDSDITLDEYDVDTIHDVWYDGSDAYGDVETALENLPGIYDAQITACQEILEGHGDESYMDEQNPDGTISDGEDEEREMLLGGFEAELDELLGDVIDGATEIGGQFRSPGIMAQVKQMLLMKARSL